MLKRLQSLRFLYVQDNDLEELPDEVGCMAWLETLEVAYNRLKAVPMSIAYVTISHCCPSRNVGAVRRFLAYQGLVS